MRELELITLPEMQEIRRLWVIEKHEFEDTLPGIYQEATGSDYPGVKLNAHSSFGADEVSKLREVCGDDELHFELLRELIDTEQQHRNLARRAGLFGKLENALRRGFYDNAQDAKDRAVRRQQAREQAENETPRQESLDGLKTQ